MSKYQNLCILPVLLIGVLGTVYEIRSAAYSTHVDSLRHFGVGMSNWVCRPQNPAVHWPLFNPYVESAEEDKA